MDQYQLSSDEQAHRELALSMARDVADYFVQRIHDVIAEKGPAHWQASGDRVTVEEVYPNACRVSSLPVLGESLTRMQVRCCIVSRWTDGRASTREHIAAVA